MLLQTVAIRKFPCNALIVSPQQAHLAIVGSGDGLIWWNCADIRDWDHQIYTPFTSE